MITYDMVIQGEFFDSTPLTSQRVALIGWV